MKLQKRVHNILWCATRLDDDKCIIVGLNSEYLCLGDRDNFGSKYILPIFDKNIYYKFNNISSFEFRYVGYQWCPIRASYDVHKELNKTYNSLIK